MSIHKMKWTMNRYTQRTDYARLWSRARELLDKGMSLGAVADGLNREGFRPPKRAAVLIGYMVGGGPAPPTSSTRRTGGGASCIRTG
jgi:hypothetical protein